MGDRANIVVYDPVDEPHSHEAVFLYTHWSGSDLPIVLQRGLERAGKAGRLNDSPYLARILFSEMTAGFEAETTGFGISTRLTDNNYPLLVVDVPRQCVVEYPEMTYRAVGFAKLARYKAVPIAAYTGAWRTK